ncbi:polysaccharide biosynthesis/export family protein [Schlesneria paludicola]|uniref:polysaccharide biosynthesis/export family protein n=1 Tax=Schlesneria paludicola TaxID=360056 RepID=UPI00029B1F4F|nr:polysaccharide biosynthesis/export family protein [Schlesneria paludicola]
MPYGFHHILKFAVTSCILVPCLMGCAAFHPMDGVPVRYLPEEMKVGERSGKRTIKLSLLEQPWDGIHRVDSGDVLGIYIGGILGKKDENPQVYFPPQNSDATPSAGIPVTVREDGTISLPMIKPLLVRGKTTSETEEAIRRAYTDHEGGRELLKPNEERILVSLLKARQTRVMVVRQDSRSEPLTNQAVGLLNIGTTKRGTGKMVSLPAYHNDVLNALVATDGLPGLDAENAVYIIRRQLGPDGKPSPISAAIDPEELIRRSKLAAEKTVVRGQNRDSWNNTGWSANGNGAFDRENQGGSQQPSSGYGPASPAQNLMNSPMGNRTIPTQPSPAAAQDKATPWTRPNFDGNSYPAVQEGYQNQPPITEDIRGGVPTIQTSHQRGDAPPVRSSYPGYATPVTPGDAQVPAAPGYSMPDPAEPIFDAPRFEMTDDLAEDSYGNFGGGDMDDGHKIIRIPIRLGPGEHVDINPEDVILYEGDIVFIESRDSEVFFTGGLLGGGQYTLPRDFDLDILRALSIATSRTGGTGAARQVGGVSALNSDVTISPSNVVVIRQLPEGGEVPIKINIYRARTDLSERLVIQPGDYIYLQYTPVEAVAAFIERHLLEGALFGVFTQNMGRNN